MANQVPSPFSANDDGSSKIENRTKMKWLLMKVLFMVTLSVVDIYSDYAVMHSYVSTGQFTLAALTFSIMKFSSLVSTVKSVKWYEQEKLLESRAPDGTGVRNSLTSRGRSINARSTEPSRTCARPSFYELWLTHQQWYVRWLWRTVVTILQISTLLSYWNTFWAAWRSLGWWSFRTSSRVIITDEAIAVTAAGDIEVGTPESQALLETGNAQRTDAIEDRATQACVETLQKKAKATWRQCKNEKFSECIIESLMQVLLQLTVVMREAPTQFDYGYLDQYSPQLISIAISSLNIMIGFYKYLARVHTFTLRDDDRRPIPDTHQTGYLVLNCLWHVLIAVSRVLLFSAVASKMLYVSLGILELHWLFMAFAYLNTRCGGLWGQQCVLNMAKSWTYCWVRISDEDETAPSQGYYFKFYGLYVFEFCILLTIYLYQIWITHAPFFAGELVLTIVFTFVLGLVVFGAYYCIKLESTKQCSSTESIVTDTRNTNPTHNAEEFQGTSGVGHMIQMYEERTVSQNPGPFLPNPSTSERQSRLKRVLVPPST